MLSILGLAGGLALLIVFTLRGMNLLVAAPVCAAVVGDVSEAELTAYARQHLAPPKRPKTWVFHDALPRTLTGKVRRDQLTRRA